MASVAQGSLRVVVFNHGPNARHVRTSVVVASTGKDVGTGRDNYHVTLKALKSRNRRPKRWLGQNYMVNEEINEDLVKAADIQAGDLVLEIGPGTGALTDALVRAGAHVIAVEKDPDMVALVSQRFQGHSHVLIFEDDFLKWHVRLHVSEWMKTVCKSSVAKQVKVVSNLPFNITTDVIKKLLPMGDMFSRVILLVQDEAALRFLGESSNSDEYRAMSLFIKFYSELEYKFKVERSNFFPQPPVNGAVVSFTVKNSCDYPQVPSVKTFFTLVRSAFNGKRKMLRTSLQHLYDKPDVGRALQSLGLPELARPHNLDLEEFVALHNKLANFD